MNVHELHLLRHAKSSWDHGGLSDHERPLNARGRRACDRLADHLRTANLHVDRVLCSSATRARETLAGIADALPDADVVVLDELYLAASDELLELVRATDDATGSLLIIGHNPGLGSFASSLCAATGSAPEAVGALQAGYPTAALASYRVHGGWATLAPGDAELHRFVRPRELDA